jgi:hypothetical protein
MHAMRRIKARIAPEKARRNLTLRTEYLRKLDPACGEEE